ncbi:unnamed protein product [Caenorhabditis auriculariae]|uniref:Uncharacterized protein n=1 Tax=Caenorhabditis auriculariae TaxID=2777116 RepID=A0A8S1HJZ6_9PELO|nr:unnamed protein product [Caenorhabditis auriculariae]
MPPPTQQELAAAIDRGEGILLKEAEVLELQKAGDLPDIKLQPGFGVYRVTKDKVEYLLVTNILCDKCKRLPNKKVMRCSQHKKKRPAKIKKAPKEKEGADDGSDRDKLNALRHVDDDEEDDIADKIENAFTPDFVLTIGAGGALVMVPIDTTNNHNAGPRATGKDHLRGVLLKGPCDCPQFLPEDKIPSDFKVKFDASVKGELVLNAQGKEIFVPETAGSGKKIDGKAIPVFISPETPAEKKVQDIFAKFPDGLGLAVVVAIGESGLPLMVPLNEKPQNRNTPVALLIKMEGRIHFAQILGHRIGAGEGAPLIEMTPENMNKLKPGDHIADIVVDETLKIVGVKPGTAGKRKVLGKAIIGQDNRIFYVPNGSTPDIAKKLELLAKENADALRQVQIKELAKASGQVPPQMEKEMNDKMIAAAASGAPDGAITPDYVMVVGAGGACALVPIETTKNDKVGPHVQGVDRVRGVLVKGDNGTPQFIMEEKLPKNWEKKYDCYVKGQLVTNAQGKEVFVPDQIAGGKEVNGKALNGVMAVQCTDKNMQKLIGNTEEGMGVPVEAAVGENGMPVMKVVTEKPKDKYAANGVLIKKGEEVHFVQVMGQKIGGQDGQLAECTPADLTKMKTGDVLGDVVVDEEGRMQAVKQGIAGGRKVIGQAVVGNNKELVFVPAGKNQAEVIKKTEANLKAHAKAMRQEQLKTMAQGTGKTPDQVDKEINNALQNSGFNANNIEASQSGFVMTRGGDQGAGAASATREQASLSKQEPHSVAIGGQVYGGQVYGGSVFARAQPKAKAVINNTGIQRGPSGEVKSAFMTKNNNEAQSQFLR